MKNRSVVGGDLAGSPLCRLGLHVWEGCRCRKCGAIDELSDDHDFDGCKCRRCGKPSPVYDDHEWDGCICRRCGKISSRHDDHDWDKCTCRKCGKVSEWEEYHDWNEACVCRKCGREQHDWLDHVCRRCHKICVHPNRKLLFRGTYGVANYDSGGGPADSETLDYEMYKCLDCGEQFEELTGSNVCGNPGAD